MVLRCECARIVQNDDASKQASRQAGMQASMQASKQANDKNDKKRLFHKMQKLA
jgi:hypothetical protein